MRCQSSYCWLNLADKFRDFRRTGGQMWIHAEMHMPSECANLPSLLNLMIKTDWETDTKLWAIISLSSWVPYKILKFMLLMMQYTSYKLGFSCKFLNKMAVLVLMCISNNMKNFPQNLLQKYCFLTFGLWWGKRNTP